MDAVCKVAANETTPGKNPCKYDDVATSEVVGKEARYGSCTYKNTDCSSNQYCSTTFMIIPSIQWIIY